MVGYEKHCAGEGKVKEATQQNSSAELCPAVFHSALIIAAPWEASVQSVCPGARVNVLPKCEQIQPETNCLWDNRLIYIPSSSVSPKVNRAAALNQRYGRHGSRSVQIKHLGYIHPSGCSVPCPETHPRLILSCDSNSWCIVCDSEQK